MKPLSLRPASRGVLTAQVMMNMLAVQLFFLMLETEELIVTTFCKKRPSCDRVIKRSDPRQQDHRLNENELVN